MASHGYPPGMMNRELQPVSVMPGGRQEILRSGSSVFNHNQLEPFGSLVIEAKPCLKMESVTKETVIMDVQDARFPSFPLGGGINEHSMSHKEAFQFFDSGHKDVYKGGLGIPMMADLVSQKLKEDEVNQLPYVLSLVYPGSEEKLISDFIGDLARHSKIVIDPEGRVLVTDTGVEMKDLLSIVAELYLSKDSVTRRKISMPIPYFDRKSFSRGRSNANGSTGKVEAAVVAPAKSPDTNKLKQSQKRRHGRKAGEERDLFKRNSFHACESLLSILVDKKGKGQTALLSLKKSGRELPDLLNQCSAGIAGTGLALVLSVICNVAWGRVPFCSAKVMSTGIGVGLMWLSWEVTKLRDTVIDIGRNSCKTGVKEDDVMDRVDRSVREIYLRAAALMALTVLRFV
ncbi:hypothetical protein MLD38_021629 [Melastoma candidum]|uniref:Uncharacterized protein n=1 Tax=Melastoma candidum TaxID=119954 RepID=A0ACB9QHW5_9MYRT|nr:hypothetical protein MLD38_021629 [Melastoma candidum]